MFSANDDDFMKSLRSRMMEVSDRDTKLPIVVLDCMLPRQVIRIEASDEVFIELVRTLVKDENPCFGMVGMVQTSSGMQVPLKTGVEVQISGKPELVESGLRLELVASRRFNIQDEVATNPKGWTEARVTFLNYEEEANEEERNNDDRFSLARAMAKARQFTSPDMSMDENKSLVDRWVQLARENERAPGQIDKLLLDLGNAPSSESPSELAFWVGALINPLPGMGVAMEIRPSLLTAKTAEERVDIALNGILTSVRHMDGTRPMW